MTDTLKKIKDTWDCSSVVAYGMATHDNPDYKLHVDATGECIGWLIRRLEEAEKELEKERALRKTAYERGMDKMEYEARAEGNRYRIKLEEAEKEIAKSKQLLKESARIFNDLIDGVPVGYWNCSIEGIIEDVEDMDKWING